VGVLTTTLFADTFDVHGPAAGVRPDGQTAIKATMERNAAFKCMTTNLLLQPTPASSRQRNASGWRTQERDSPRQVRTEFLANTGFES
jgi:hypothetical protein